ncbi:dynamin family protein [Hydrotalea sp.]|uniref:dynamin family protein n=1 Tax=Hydrotalea sp. TaxID=2881279 RepID=UPI002633F904|nr:dynamin family protein [Hydrotalea sp.]
MPTNSAYIQLLLQTADQLEQKSLVDDLVQLQKKLNDEEINVVITGIFKRGKSTLINALIGENIMPTGVVPVTAIITILKYAAFSAIEIVYKNKTSEKKALHCLQQYVSEEDNPENIKNVSHVIVYHHAPLLQQITIIDTPGVGSSFEHNTDTTLQFLTKIDIAIFVLSADMPVSKSDIEFLTQLKSQIKNIVFVENKKDLLNTADLEKVITHNKKIIAQQCNMTMENVTVIPISAYQHLQGNTDESGFKNLVAVLEKNITQNKTSILLQSTARQLALIEQSLQSLIQLRIDNLQMPVQELYQRMNHFQSTQSVLLNEIEGFQAILQHHIQKLNETVHTHCNDKAKNMETDVIALIESYLHPAYQLLNKPEQQQLIKTLNKMIRSSFEKLKTQLEESSKAQFKQILEQYLFNSKNILHNIAIHFSGYLNTGIETIVEKFDWKAYTAFYITLNGLDKEVILTKNSTHFMLSKKDKEKYISKAILEQYHEIIIHNTAAIIYEVQYKIQESFRKFNADFKLKVQQLLQTLEQEMSTTMEKTKTLNFNTKESIATLENIKNRLNNFSKTG